MKKLTKKESVELHRKLWNWVADETLRLKRKVYGNEYFEKMRISTEDVPCCHCYCCEYDELYNPDKNCYYCPIKWGDDNEKCGNNMHYKLWSTSEDYKEAAKYARKIANMPEREDYEGEE